MKPNYTQRPVSYWLVRQAYHATSHVVHGTYDYIAHEVPISLCVLELHQPHARRIQIGHADRTHQALDNRCDPCMKAYMLAILRGES